MFRRLINRYLVLLNCTFLSSPELLLNSTLFLFWRMAYKFQLYLPQLLKTQICLFTQRMRWTVVEPDMPATVMTWKEEDINIPLHKLFWDAWQANSYHLPEGKEVSLIKINSYLFDTLDHECCYTFELLSHKHRNIVRIPDWQADSIYLIAVRNMSTFQEQNIRVLAVCLLSTT